MPREVFDPKNPDPEFYNTQKSIEKRHYTEKPRRKNIFKSRAFMIGYGVFLLLIISAITMYQKKSLDIPMFNVVSKFLKSNALSIKINSVETFSDRIKATIEIENKKYKTDENSIETLVAHTILSSNKTIIASNYNVYNNVRFRHNERIGYSSTFNKYLWQSSDTIHIKLNLDDHNIFEKKINTRLLKSKK